MATSAEYTPLNHGGTPQSRLSPRTKRIGLRVVGVAVVSTVLAVCVFAFKSARRIDAAAALRTPIVSQVSPEHAGPTEDAIADLPGTPKAYTSRLFSGSLPVRSGGNGFYFFAESQSSTPLNDPMLLWLNGGPGASSLSGCFSENGPLLVNDGGQSLRVNEYAWNRNANMLCIESPIGVGFTYNASGVYKSDDVAQADDLYWMLQSFFTKFPWLRENDFIISGESYGGVYVPMTAKRIVEGNLGGEEPKINLKRFAVGNGITEYHGLSVVKFAYYHGLVGTDAYTSVVSKCPQLSSPAAPLNASLDEACTAELGTFQETIADIGINNYDIYAKCTGGSLSGMNALIERLKGPNQAEPRPIAMNVGLCLDWSDLATYFNLPSVRKAMHTNPKIEEWSMVSLTSANFDLGQVLNVSGTELRDIIKNKVLDYTPSIGMTVTPVWRYLLDHNISGVIYHGDTDMACDFMGGLWAVESLQLPRERARDVWNVRGSNQTAGFVENFGSLKYVTVKGAGHMVPTDKPAEAKAMLDQFILSE